ncbi:tyrosine-protein phosphatase [Phenylobacterium sp.]|uniref:tyrosine-protein phosphatase n=1 Tax=Phenylobacterium sp. TaxID=1871053 RepID=UPI0035B4F245
MDLRSFLIGLALAAAAPPAALCAVTEADLVRQADGRLLVTWTAGPGETVDVLTAPSPTTPRPLMTVSSAADADGRHLLPASPKAVQVVLSTRDGQVYRLAERVQPLAGASNFRDIGGYRTADGRQVRWGAIYRSAELSGLTPADYEFVRSLGLRMIYDLRSTGERTREPTRWVGAGAPPILAKDYGMDESGFLAALGPNPTAESARRLMTRFYPALVGSHRDQFRTVFEKLIAPEDGAVLYHCSAGKDRTGVLSALILTALRVPRETVLQDFELSNAYYRPPVSRGGASMVSAVPPDALKVLMGVDRAYLEAFFDELDRRYGGVEGYLDVELGIDATELAVLRNRYTY